MHIIQTSMIGSVLIALALILRRIKWIPYNFIVLLWVIAIARLLLPFEIRTPVGLIPWVDSETVTIRDGADFQASDTSTSALLFDLGYDALPGKASKQERTLPIIWCIGSISILIYFISSYIRSLQKYSLSLPLDNEVISQTLTNYQANNSVRIRVSDRIAAPLTYGVLAPTIVFPKDIDWNDFELVHCITLHELQHIRFHDVLIKWALVFSVCFHWLNPFVWFMLIFANQDLEYRCDRAVVDIQNNACMDPKRYARSLVQLKACSMKREYLNGFFSQSIIKERVERIIANNKRSLKCTAWSWLAVALIMFVFATSPFLPREVIAKAPFSICLNGKIIPVSQANFSDDEDFSANAGPATLLWNKEGALPGENGCAMISGYTTWRGRESVLQSVAKLSTGEIVSILYNDGRKKDFRVTDKRTIPYSSSFYEAYMNTENALLMFVSCTGAYASSIGTSESRNIVTCCLIGESGYEEIF